MPRAGQHLTDEQLHRMTSGGSHGLPTKARRHQALTLAETHLTGQQLRDAKHWLRKASLTGAQLDGFITRMQAAHPTDTPER